MLKTAKLILFSCFGVLICVCSGAEIYQIVYEKPIHWNDALHNLVDHVVYLMVNYVAIMTVLRKPHH